MDAPVIVIVVAVLAAAALATYRWSRSRAAPGRWSPPAAPGARDSGVGTVVLDLEVADHTEEAVRRLADSVGREALHRAEATVAEIVVTDRAGQVLATVARATPLPDLALPGGGPERTPTRPRQPQVRRSRSTRPSIPTREGADGDATVARDLASRYVLPPTIEGRLGHRADGTALVRAILEAAGHELTVADGVLRSGDHAVIVVGDASGHGVSHDELSRAFLRFQRSGARHGTVVVLGYVSAREVSRRRALAPEVSYVGPAAIQRMADAAALGVDPLRFAAGGLS